LDQYHVGGPDGPFLDTTYAWGGIEDDVIQTHAVLGQWPELVSNVGGWASLSVDQGLGCIG